MANSIHFFQKLLVLFFAVCCVDAMGQPPVITSFNPSSGVIGSTVTITGSNFDAIAANNIVYFGGSKAAVSGGNATSLTVTAPAGTTYQPISVLNTNTALTGYSAVPFIITFTNPFGTGIPANFFAPKVDFTTGTNPRSVVIGDIDGDGKSDLVVVNGNSNTIAVLHNISVTGVIDASSFAPKVDFASGTFSAHADIADVDNDGKLDIIVINSNNISILRNTSISGTINAASFAAKVDFDLVFTGPVFIAIGDLDRDGKADLVAANAGSASVSVLRNTSTPGIINATSFAPKVNFTTGTTPYSVSIADVDGDLKPELVIANAGVAANSVSVLRNTSTPGIINATSFAPKVDFTAGNAPRSVIISDLDNDGKPDLAIANSSPSSTTLSVLRNTSMLGIIDASSFAAKVDLTTATSPQAVDIGDLDGDGKPDIVNVNVISNSFSAFRNNTTPGTIDNTSFASKVDFTTGNGPVSISVGDLDGDGIPEVVSANGTGSSVSVFQIDLTAIPVTLVNTRAYRKNAGVMIEWTSLDEVNIQSYVVERSQKGQQFDKIGNIAASGHSSTSIAYRLFDQQPLKGLSFYRIKIIEAGRSMYSDVMKVSNNASEQLTIYPNPVYKGSSLTLEMNLPLGTYKVRLLNTVGQQLGIYEIKQETILSTHILDIATLPAGSYQLSVSGGNINVVNQIIKE